VIAGATQSATDGPKRVARAGPLPCSGLAQQASSFNRSVTALKHRHVWDCGILRQQETWMQWILTVAEPLSLADLVSSSEWLLLPPTGRSRSRSQFTRVEHLTSGHTTLVTVSQVATGLMLHTQHRLSSHDTAELSQRIWRMLRLGDNLTPFAERARNTPQLADAAMRGARLLRGATVFEDAVRAVCLSQAVEVPRPRTIGRVVDAAGAPLPSNPTRHAFPTPQQLLQVERSALQFELGMELTDALIATAEVFHCKTDHLNSLLDSRPSTTRLTAELRSLLALTEPGLDFLLFCLGRYDHIPASYSALSSAKYPTAPIRDGSLPDPHQHFAAWQPWGGLAYWLWDWTLIPEAQGSDPG